MPSFFVNRSLSRGDLTLFLNNGEGLSQDGYDVRWTVYKQDGSPASGYSVPAVKATTGEYYAPWGCAKVGGCYYVKWEYSVAPGALRQTWCQSFFVLDGASGSCCTRSTAPAGTDPTECGMFIAGQTLGCGDLCIVIEDDDGLPASAFLVVWTVYDSHGCPVSPRTVASLGSSLGQYCVSWTACGAGNYVVKWEWMLESDSPMESTCSKFSVVNPPAVLSRCWYSFLDPCARVVESPCAPSVPSFNPVYMSPVPCAGPPSPSPSWPIPVQGTISTPCAPSSPVFVPPSPACPPSFCKPQSGVIVVKECCDGTSIPRTVVLVSQVLPLGGLFTNQAPFAFSPAIRHVAFYIKYAHGVSGGFPVMRLMWGNGFEEIQSTVINASFTTFDGNLATQQMRVNDLLGPIPDSDEPVYFMLESSVPGGSTTVRLLMAEGGALANPGTVEITLTGSSD